MLDNDFIQKAPVENVFQILQENHVSLLNIDNHLATTHKPAYCQKQNKFYIEDEDDSSDSIDNDEDKENSFSFKVISPKNFYNDKADNLVDEDAFMKEFQKRSPPPIKGNAQSLLTLMLKSQGNHGT